MLKIAQQRHIYDNLVCSDLIEFLQTRTKIFDVVVAADVFVYIGDLSQAFHGARSALRDGGLSPPHENPIQRPPHATPNHRASDMSAVKRPSSGRSEARPVRVTRRRTVNVKKSARNSDVIFTQKGKL